MRHTDPVLQRNKEILPFKFLIPDFMKKILIKNKKFRFLLLVQWLLENKKPCKAVDVGGGKGLLAYLLNQNEWEVRVVDPLFQELPLKYTDLNKQKIKIPESEKVNRISKPFIKEMIKDYDLIIGLHAHGVNMKIIKECAEKQRNFVLLPCCVIDEPIILQRDINWLNSLEDYGKSLGLDIKRFELNFKGQNVGIYN